MKMEMTKFLQQTLDEMAVSSKGHSSLAAKNFAEFFQKVSAPKYSIYQLIFISYLI